MTWRLVIGTDLKHPLTILIASFAVVRAYSHCVADIGDSRRDVASSSDLLVHITKCGITDADTCNVKKLVRLIERMTMPFKFFFFIHSNVKVFFLFVHYF